MVHRHGTYVTYFFLRFLHSKYVQRVQGQVNRVTALINLIIYAMAKLNVNLNISSENVFKTATF